MVYATRQDMIDRFGEQELIALTDRDGAGVIHPEVLGTALLDAAAEIDSYLESQYTLPMASIPSALLRICCDIARFRLYDEKPTEAVSQRYNAAVRFLDSVAKGAIRIGPAQDGSEPVKSGQATMTSGGRVFGRSDHGFI